MKPEHRFPEFFAALKHQFLASMSEDRVRRIYAREPAVDLQEAARRYALCGLKFPPWHPCFEEETFASLSPAERDAFEDYHEGLLAHELRG